MLWATDMLRPATISGSSPRPIALKRVAHAIHPRFKPRNDPIAAKNLQQEQVSAEPKIFLHLSPNFGAVMLWATDMLRPATISGSSPRPIALKRVAHAIHPRFKPRND